MASKNGPKPKEKILNTFQWWSEIIDHLILSLKDYGPVDLPVEDSD
jgi:hypothetical protein